LRKKLTTYIEEEDIKKLKKLALEQDTSVSDILCSLVSKHFNIKIVCISDLNKYLDSGSVKYNDKLFNYTKYEDLGDKVNFYNNDELVLCIESEFFELYKNNKYIELIPIEVKDFALIDNDFVKKIK